MLLGSVPELMQMKTSIEDLLRVGKTVHLLAQITEQDDPVGFKNLQDLVNQLRRPTNPATGGKKKPTNPPAAAKPISLTRLNHQETTGAQWASVVQSVCGKLVKKGTNPSPKP
jgi:hypothetical protein